MHCYHHSGASSAPKGTNAVAHTGWAKAGVHRLVGQPKNFSPLEAAIFLDKETDNSAHARLAIGPDERVESGAATAVYQAALPQARGNVTPSVRNKRGGDHQGCFYDCYLVLEVNQDIPLRPRLAQRHKKERVDVVSPKNLRKLADPPEKALSLVVAAVLKTTVYLGSLNNISTPPPFTNRRLQKGTRDSAPEFRVVCSVCTE